MHGLQRSMGVAVVRVWKMRVGMQERRMVMRMGMRLAWAAVVLA